VCLDKREGRLHLVHRRREWDSQRVMEEKIYDLGLPVAGSRVIRHGGEGPDFWAYVDDGRHLHYVSYWLPNKIRVMRLPRSSSGDLQVLSPYYARIGNALYCRGARVPDADADQFQLIAETRFAHDREHVYAFTITEGLDMLEHAVRPLHFLPRCEHFADHRDFYWQSSWTGKIERVSRYARIDAYEKRTVLRACLWQDTDAQTDEEQAARDAILDSVRTLDDLFRLALPRADAVWAAARPAQV
jgi:hypothetical protein